MRAIRTFVLALGLLAATSAQAAPDFGWCGARVTATNHMTEQEFRYVFHIEVAFMAELEDVKGKLTDQIGRNFDLRNTTPLIAFECTSDADEAKLKAARAAWLDAVKAEGFVVQEPLYYYFSG